MQKRNLIITVIAVTLAILFYSTYYAQQKKEFALSQKEKGLVFVEVKPIQTSIGWGYDIMVDGKRYIHQDFIPGISGRRGFDSKEQAMLVGNKVVSKVTGSKMSPSINIEDLIELGIPLKASDTARLKK